MKVISILLLLLLTANAQAKDECLDWLKRGGSNPAKPDCELQCAKFRTDVGTLECSLDCHDFCHPKKNQCDLAPVWSATLKGNPTPFKSLAGDELKMTINALKTLPESFRPKALKAIVRASQPADITTLTSPATSSNEFIILFPRAFSGSTSLDRILAHESVHFLEASEWKSQFDLYKKENGWTSALPRPGGFVEADGKFSPEEDFANNVEYFMYDPKKLKAVSPKIFKWIDVNLGPSLKLKKGCADDK